MKRQAVHTGKRLLWACIPFLALSLSLPAAAATAASAAPKPGSYCPDTNILLVVAEELSASLELVMRSRTALINKDQTAALGNLASARTILHLAASRGAAARTTLLIDAILQAKSGEDNVQLLTWFPLLHTSLQTLPEDAAVSAANDLIDRSADIMQSDKDSDAMAPLREARHLLACDGLDIPLQQAMQAQDDLMQQLNLNTKNRAYNDLRDALRSALAYTLGNGGK